MSARGFGGDLQEGTGREINHPKVIGKGGFKGFGGAAKGLQSKGAALIGIEMMDLEETVNRAQGRQIGIFLLPLAVEIFKRNQRSGTGLLEDGFHLGGSKGPGFAFVGAGLRMKLRKAALFKHIPPVFQGSDGIGAGGAIRTMKRDKGGHEERLAEGYALAQRVLDLGHHGKTLKSERLGVVGGVVLIHAKIKNQRTHA